MKFNKSNIYICIHVTLKKKKYMVNVYVFSRVA